VQIQSNIQQISDKNMQKTLNKNIQIIIINIINPINTFINQINNQQINVDMNILYTILNISQSINQILLQPSLYDDQTLSGNIIQLQINILNTLMKYSDPNLLQNISNLAQQIPTTNIKNGDQLNSLNTQITNLKQNIQTKITK
jgi:hypothetical protein